MNPRVGTHRELLRKAVKHHWEQLAWLRKSNKRLVELAAGSEYGKTPMVKRPKDLLGLMRQTADAYSLAMSANAPRFLGSTDVPEQFGFAQHFSRALNALVIEIRIEQTFEDLIRDAFYSMGIGKTYLASSGQVQVQTDVWMDPGSPFFQRISPDNFVFDTSATDFRAKAFSADRYTIPFSELGDADRFDQRVVKRLSARSKSADNETDLARSIAQGTETDADEYEPMIDLAEIYLARERLICVHAVDRDFSITSDPLAVLDWDGPEEGPHDMLSFGPVSDNIAPASPAAALRGLHELTNSLFRAQNRQATRQKDVTIFPSGGEKDAKNIQQAKDGDITRVDNPEQIKVLKFGGADASTLGFLLQTMNMFDRMAGNLSAMAGLGPQSGTAAQDQMIHEQVSRREAWMMNKVMRFMSKIGSNLGNLLFNDSAKVIPGQVDLGLDGYKPVDATWYPGLRQGSFKDYQLKVEPYSSSFKSPSQRLGQINQVVGQFLQNPQLLAEQGVQFDLQELISLSAELLNEPRLLRVFKFNQEIRRMEEQQGSPGPSNTSRTYVRKNVAAGGSPQAQNSVMSQMLMSGGGAAVSPQQANSVMLQ